MVVVAYDAMLAGNKFWAQRQIAGWQWMIGDWVKSRARPWGCYAWDCLCINNFQFSIFN